MSPKHTTGVLLTLAIIAAGTLVPRLEPSAGCASRDPFYPCGSCRHLASSYVPRYIPAPVVETTEGLMTKLGLDSVFTEKAEQVNGRAAVRCKPCCQPASSAALPCL